jgi:Amidase
MTWGRKGGEANILDGDPASEGMLTDIGGSIRLPAHFCGVCGHKPTYGLIPLTGHALSPFRGGRRRSQRPGQAGNGKPALRDILAD